MGLFETVEDTLPPKATIRVSHSLLRKPVNTMVRPSTDFLSDDTFGTIGTGLEHLRPVSFKRLGIWDRYP